MKGTGMVSLLLGCAILSFHHSFGFIVPFDGNTGTGSHGFKPRMYRDYYLQAEKIEWDYLPQQKNLVGFDNEWVALHSFSYVFSYLLHSLYSLNLEKKQCSINIFDNKQHLLNSYRLIMHTFLFKWSIYNYNGVELRNKLCYLLQSLC